MMLTAAWLRCFHCLAERETDATVDDEAAVREAWLLRIAAAVVRALDLGPSLVMEEQMLAVRASNGGGRAQPPPRELPALAQGVAQAAAALARSDRERLRAGVFRPSHILPTMTIEQFGACLSQTTCQDSWLNPSIASSVLQVSWRLHACRPRQRKRRGGRRKRRRSCATDLPQTLTQRRTPRRSKRGHGTTGRCDWHMRI
jgi:hypothetical protein